MNTLRPSWLVTKLTLTVTFFVIFLGGCASDGVLQKAVGKTLQAVGVASASPAKPVLLPLRLHAGSNLNAGNDGRASAVVLRVYRLQSGQRFEQAPFNAFLSEKSEQAALGDDLLSVREVVLSPGLQQELQEELSDNTHTLGIVALFRSPAENRWRLAYDATDKALRREGITIGVHACALTTGSPGLLSRYAGKSDSLASIRCAKSR